MVAVAINIHNNSIEVVESKELFEIPDDNNFLAVTSYGENFLFQNDNQWGDVDRPVVLGNNWNKLLERN